MQKISSDIPKNLDYNLTPAELVIVQHRLRSANQRLVAYDVTLSADEAEARKIFEFAKSLNVESLVASPPPDALAMVDKLATEFGINIAILNGNPQKLEGRSPRMGVCVDTGLSKDIVSFGQRLLGVHLRDRSAMRESLEAIYRAGLKPSFITVLPISGDVAELSRSYDSLEKILQPLAAERVAELGRTTPIRGPERIRSQDRERVIAAIHASVPPQAQARPKKARKLLVVDLNVAYPGHGSIPAANLAIDLWGKKTGSYEATFSNDLENLKHPKIKEFDAVFLNNTVGQLFPDPQVREGLMRFIREGGGLGGYHGMPHASIDWTEFGDMLAARAGSHRSPTEKVIVKIDDPSSPLTAAFEGQEFEFFDEFYRFTSPPYSREKVHVLLSFNTEKTDLHQLPNCDICIRPDNDYPIAWIRSFGKGRIFYATVGHSSTVFESPKMSRFFLAGIQFILGDLDADTTPGIKN